MIYYRFLIEITHHKLHFIKEKLHLSTTYKKNHLFSHFPKDHLEEMFKEGYIEPIKVKKHKGKVVEIPVSDHRLYKKKVKFPKPFPVLSYKINKVFSVKKSQKSDTDYVEMIIRGGTSQKEGTSLIENFIKKSITYVNKRLEEYETLLEEKKKSLNILKHKVKTEKDKIEDELWRISSTQSDYHIKAREFQQKDLSDLSIFEIHRDLIDLDKLYREFVDTKLQTSYLTPSLQSLINKFKQELLTYHTIKCNLIEALKELKAHLQNLRNDPLSLCLFCKGTYYEPLLSDHCRPTDLFKEEDPLKDVEQYLEEEEPLTQIK